MQDVQDVYDTVPLRREAKEAGVQREKPNCDAGPRANSADLMENSRSEMAI